MSIISDVKKLLSVNAKIAQLECERKEIYRNYELLGEGAVNLLNKTHEEMLEKQLQKKSEGA